MKNCLVWNLFENCIYVQNYLWPKNHCSAFITKFASMNLAQFLLAYGFMCVRVLTQSKAKDLLLLQKCGRELFNIYQTCIYGQIFERAANL